MRFGVLKIQKPDSKSIEFFLLIILYRIALDIAYSMVIVKYYSYLGFYSNPTIYSQVVSWVMLLIFSMIFMRYYKNLEGKISYEIAFFLFLMSFIPFTCMVGYSAVTTKFLAYNTIYWVAFVFFLSLIRDRNGKRIKIVSIKKRIIGDQQIKIIAVVFALVIIYISWRYTNFRLNLSLLNVYDLRAEARTYNWPTILTYAFSWTRMMNSIILAYFLKQKKWVWAIGCIFVQLLSFGIDGSKTTFILMLFTIAIFMIPSFNLETCNKWVLRGFTFITAGSLIWFIISRNIVLVSLFVRRIFFAPIQIAGNYVDFFSSHVPDFFRQSFLRHLGFESPYDQSLPYLIADVYADKVSSFNNGLISDAMANLGPAGLIIMPLLLVIVLKLLDYSAEGLDIRIYITVALYASVVLTNSFLFTVLLTHGLIVAMILLRMMERDSAVNIQNQVINTSQGNEV